MEKCITRCNVRTKYTRKQWRSQQFWTESKEVLCPRPGPRNRNVGAPVDKMVCEEVPGCENALKKPGGSTLPFGCLLGCGGWEGTPSKLIDS
jgi:hypothetical protein